DEVPVVGLVTEVPAVGPVRRPVLGGDGDAVVEHLPDEAALQAVVGLDRRPVVGEVAAAVAHGVGVLAHDERAVVGGRPGPLDDAVDRRVHGADDVGGGVPAGPVRVDRT